MTRHIRLWITAMLSIAATALMVGLTVAAHAAGGRRLAMEALPWPAPDTPGPIWGHPARPGRLPGSAGHAQADHRGAGTGLEPVGV